MRLFVLVAFVLVGGLIFGGITIMIEVRDKGFSGMIDDILDAVETVREFKKGKPRTKKEE